MPAFGWAQTLLPGSSTLDSPTLRWLGVCVPSEGFIAAVHRGVGVGKAFPWSAVPFLCPSSWPCLASLPFWAGFSSSSSSCSGWRRAPRQAKKAGQAACPHLNLSPPPLRQVGVTGGWSGAQIFICILPGPTLALRGPSGGRRGVVHRLWSLVIPCA